MPDETIVIYATDWCWDCRRTKNFFERRGIPYQWINIDRDQAAEKLVIEINHGNRSVPTIILPGGKILVEPSNQTLVENFPEQ